MKKTLLLLLYLTLTTVGVNAGYSHYKGYKGQYDLKGFDYYIVSSDNSSSRKALNYYFKRVGARNIVHSRYVIRRKGYGSFISGNRKYKFRTEVNYDYDEGVDPTIDLELFITSSTSIVPPKPSPIQGKLYLPKAVLEAKATHLRQIPIQIDFSTEGSKGTVSY